MHATTTPDDPGAGTRLRGDGELVVRADGPG